MRYRLAAIATALALLLSSPAVRAEVQAVCERHDGNAATAAFKFRSVPPPSQTDAATNARFTIVAGEVDPNSGDVEMLNDGRLPGGDDQPDANFFFEAGTAGGRLAVDLGDVAEIRQVNTYSWHRSTRGPQVYTLYASDGSARDFQARPAKGIRPEQVGWKRIAAVDTRREGQLGGQYGVSIRDPAGTLGVYRHLLFDIARTEDADRFGNTFFSEIDVSDGREHAAVPARPGKFEITFNTAEMPELQEWVDSRLRPVCETWYPRIAQMLGGDGFQPPRRCTVTFRKDMRGVAHTAGKRIECAGDWFRRNLNGEAAGAVVHELVHVVQQDGRARGGPRSPGWLVEGVADYIRWFKYEPASARPRPNPATAKYTDSYRTTAAFLNYVAQTHGADFVTKLSAAMRAGRYYEGLWKESTGRTVDELWVEYVKTLKPLP